MILYNKSNADPSSDFDIWAVETNTLTIARCKSDSKDQIDIQTLLRSDKPLICSHSQPDNSQKPAMLIADNLLKICTNQKKIEVTGHESTCPPEWMLMLSGEGTQPAIIHTIDPLFIAFVDPLTSRLDAPTYYQSQIDLSVEGWEYWWTDAQDHFEKLAVEFAMNYGQFVPEYVKSAI